MQHLSASDLMSAESDFLSASEEASQLAEGHSFGSSWRASQLQVPKFTIGNSAEEDEEEEEEKDKEEEEGEQSGKTTSSW